MVSLSLGPLEAAVAQATPGTEPSGDVWLAELEKDRVLVGLFDGLGHGEAARVAAESAVEVVRSLPDSALDARLRRAHEQVKTTRGCVATLVEIAPMTRTLTWVGVGNVECVLAASSFGREVVIAKSGIIGSGRLPKLSPRSVPWSDGDLLVLATDGIDRRFVVELLPWSAPDVVVSDILARFDSGKDDATVVAARLRGIDL